MPDGNTDTKNNYMVPATAIKPSWAPYRAVHQVSVPGTGAVTTLCFSRRMQEPTASVSKQLSSDSPVHIIWAVCTRRDFAAEHEWHGSFDLNLATGAATVTTANVKLQRMNVHGALMTVAWVGLLPLGTLMARHR